MTSDFYARVDRTDTLIVPKLAVTWSAVLAGAEIALATLLVLTLLAAGFGFRPATARVATRGVRLAAFTPFRRDVDRDSGDRGRARRLCRRSVARRLDQRPCR